MATTITRQVMSRSAPNPITTEAADAAGNNWINSGDEYLLIKNGGGSPCVVTKEIQRTIDGAAAVDPTISVAAGDDTIIGPFPENDYNDANARMNVTYDQVTTVTVAVLKAA